jgi:hypothetical protein
MIYFSPFVFWWVCFCFGALKNRQVSLCIWGWPQTFNSPASASLVLGLQVWNTTVNSHLFLCHSFLVVSGFKCLDTVVHIPYCCWHKNV